MRTDGMTVRAVFDFIRKAFYTVKLKSSGVSKKPLSRLQSDGCNPKKRQD